MADQFHHVWFSTKLRKPALQEELAREIKLLLRQIAVRSGIELLEMEAVVDHVHLLIRLRPQQTLSSVIHQLKGASARSIFLSHPELRIDLGHNSFWQKGYGFRRIDPLELSGVRQYIRTQESRPLRRS